MTDITDQQRREVAARLRELEPWSAEGDIEVDKVLTALGMVYGYTDTDLEIDSVHTLADLIDRPTCQNVSATGNFACSECGADYAMSIDVLRYCPDCGAEVVGYE